MSRLVYLLVAVLSLLQGLQPLLHAHVGGMVHESGLLHFHSAAGEFQVPDASAKALRVVRVADTAAITVGESFRRHLAPGWTSVPAPGARAGGMLPEAGAAPQPPLAIAPPAVWRHLVPPALAPPAYS